MADIRDFILAQQQASRPNPLQALGTGIAGFAAPQLGQQWQNPYIQKQGSGGGMNDLLSMMMMQQMMGENGAAPAAPTAPVAPSQPSTQPGTGPPQPYYTPLEGSMFKKFQGEDLLSKMKRDIFVKGKEAKIGVSKTEETELSKRYGQAARVVGAFRNIQANFKRADKEFGPSGARAALTYDAARLRYAPNWVKKAAKALQPAEAQSKEVTIALLPILSGQARYVQSLAENIAKTVPGVAEIGETRDDLTAQSVRNNMTLVYGIQNGFFNAKSLRERGLNPDASVQNKLEAQALLRAVKLTKEQEKSIDAAIKYTLNAPAAKPAKAYKGDTYTDENVFEGL